MERIIRWFIREPDRYEKAEVRLAYGRLSSYVGILCNVLLFIIKSILAYFSHSISLFSDAFNNLSDSFSCIITLVGYRIAAKPADKEHPFGHGRVEYLVGLIVSIIIFLVSLELFKSSLLRIIHPEEIQFSWFYIVVFVFSIAIKIGLGYFNQKLGERIHNIAMMGAAQDSRNDVVATTAAFLGMVLSFFFPQIPFDGIFGIFVSIFVFYAGYGIAKEIFDKLIGEPADSSISNAIKELLLSQPQILGVHDMMIHDYGPGRRIGSAHIELDSSMSFMEAHEVTDDLERRISQAMNMEITLHMDPIQINDLTRERYFKLVCESLANIDNRLSVHDFRIIKKKQEHILVFDLVKPFHFGLTNEELKNRIEEKFKQESVCITTIISFEEADI